MLAPQRWLLFLGALAVAALIPWVSRGPGSAPSVSSSPARAEPQGAAPTNAASKMAASKMASSKSAASALPEVSTLYEEATSAYHARLFADEGAVVLVTQTGFTTLRAGEAPARHAISLGPVVARQGDALVFWRSGKLRAISLTAENERELAVVPAPPQYLLASGGQLAWIQTTREGGTSIQTLSGSGVRVVFKSEESVSAAISSASFIYWVSERRDGSWHIGRVGLDGQHTSTAVQRGRPPAMLALGPDGLYFYAGPERGVRRLTFDLKLETAVLAKVICSPLAVSSRVVCAQVGGLFEIPPASSAPRFLAVERAGPVTTVGATAERAFWVAERGDGQLVVRSVVLPEP